MGKKIRAYIIRVILFLFGISGAFASSDVQIDSSWRTAQMAAETGHIPGAWQEYRQIIRQTDLFLYNQIISALQALGIHIFSAHRPTYEQWCIAYLNRVGLGGVQIAFLIVLFIFCGASLLRMMTRIMFFLGLVIISFHIVTLWVAYTITAPSYGLIVEKSQLYNGPGEQFVPYTSVEKYTECVIERNKDGWIKVDAGLKKGWIASKNVLLEQAK